MSYNDYKKSGIIHKIVKQNITSHLHNNISSLDIVQFIENDIKKLTKYNNLSPLDAGIAFPVGTSINNIAAHFTPCDDINPIVFGNDIVKIDYGVHINGCITDGAFSWCPSGKYNDLIDISEKATMIGIKHAGPDAVLGDIGKYIQEYIESKELEIDGKILPVKSIYDLCGHKIAPYEIHAKKAVPNVYLPYYKVRMKPDEVYAVETFPTLGDGSIITEKECNHFMITKYNKKFNGNTMKIYNERKTLAFCPRWFDFDIPDNKYIQKHPVLKANGVVAQYEKTIYIKNDGLAILN